MIKEAKRCLVCGHNLIPKAGLNDVAALASSEWLAALAERFERRAEKWSERQKWGTNNAALAVETMYRELAADFRAESESAANAVTPPISETAETGERSGAGALPADVSELKAAYDLAWDAYDAARSTARGRLPDL